MPINRLLSEQERRLDEEAATQDDLRLARLVHGVVTEQVAPIAARVSSLETRVVATENTLVELLGAVRENTTVTNEIRDLITAGRVVKRAADGAAWAAGIVGKFALWGAALYGAWLTFIGKGPHT